jgi:NTP pyrophosphatase (non-canonical NTP hydrolase)
MEKTSIQKLTEIQQKVGYIKGSINNVALLGLFGEAGEVLNECKIRHNGIITPLPLDGAIEKAEQVDRLKKAIRNGNAKPHEIVIENEELFDNELADVLYYLNALALNRGKTIEDYAELSYQKVLRKSQTDISHGTINSETLTN